MSETFHAVVQGVYQEDLGDALTAAASVGATVLQVKDVADFDEEGGFLLLNEAVLEYDTIDDDTSTITLTIPLAAAAAVDDRVDVWDDANGQKASVYKAVVDQIDGFDGVATAVVSQGLAHALAQTMRDGTGESVTLSREDSELQVTAVHGRGFSLAALQYLQGGMTTRQAEDEAGVDILGSDTGTPGIRGYGAGGTPTVIVDALTGDASFIGEIGTAMPGDPGVFIYSPTFSQFGGQVSHPTIQLNTGATRDQPSIQADSTGGGQGVWLFSGASTGGRESHVVADQGSVTAAIERTADSSPDYGSYWTLADDSFSVVIHAGAGNGGLLELLNDQIIFQTDYTLGGSNLAAVVIGNSSTYQAGFRDNTDGSVQGMWLSRGGDVVLSTLSGVDVQNPSNTSFKPIAASAFNVNSDPTSKTDIEDAPDAVSIIRAAPAKQWRYNDDPVTTRRIGPMADALPEWMVGRRPEDLDLAPGKQYVDLIRMNGVLWRAVEQQADQIDELTARVERLEQALTNQAKEG